MATGDVMMHVRSCKPVQGIMTAIRLGQPVAECGFALASNAQAQLRSRLRLGNLYSAEELAETVRVAQLCHFSRDELRDEHPSEIVSSGQTAAAYLRA